MKSSSSHDKINLARLLARLDTLVHAAPTPLDARPWWEIRKLNDDAKFARELLDSVAASEAGQVNRGEGTSTTLDEYELQLNRISMTLILASSDPQIPKGPVYTLLPPAPISLIPAPLVVESADAADLDMLPEPPTSSLQARAPSEDMTMVALHSSPAPVPPVSAPPMGILPEPSREPSPPLSSRTIARPTTSLLPDAPPPSNSLTARELLGLRERRTRPAPPGEGKSIKDSNSGNISEGLMSTSRVHDELTEQLAMMSTQLRKNAAHFASSLQAEKPLLEESSILLESNLTKMTGSKGRLSTVSSKGRGNTWLVLGSVAAVCLLWLWMYFIIRFT